jgi:hypothetical protein
MVSSYQRGGLLEMLEPEIPMSENVERLFRLVVKELKTKEELTQFCTAMMIVSGALVMSELEKK